MLKLTPAVLNQEAIRGGTVTKTTPPYNCNAMHTHIHIHAYIHTYCSRDALIATPGGPGGGGVLALMRIETETGNEESGGGQC